MWKVEHTDTFSGVANYSWVNRYTINPAKYTQRSIVRAAKAACGLTRVRCDVTAFGDSYEIRPRGICQVVFVTWEEECYD